MNEAYLEDSVDAQRAQESEVVAIHRSYMDKEKIPRDAIDESIARLESGTRRAINVMSPSCWCHVASPRVLHTPYHFCDPMS